MSLEKFASKLKGTALDLPGFSPSTTASGVTTVASLGATPAITTPASPAPQVEGRAPFVMVCVPSGRSWESRTSTAVAGLAAYSALNGVSIGIINLEGSMITKQRNDIVDMALKANCDYIMWIDSVTADTPILVRRKGEKMIDFIEACELMPPSYRLLKQRTYISSEFEVLTHEGWQAPRAVMQAKVKKPILRVTDENGMVCVTEDHSLFSKGEAIAGRDIVEGTSLDHINLNAVVELPSDILPVTPEYAEVLGFFAAEGTCGEYEDADGYAQFQWNICNTNKPLLEKYAAILRAVHAREFGFVADEKKRSDGSVYNTVWKLNARRCIDLVQQYRAMFYTATGKKRVPKMILNAPKETMEAFLRGYEIGDGYATTRKGTTRQLYTTNSMTLAAGLHFMCARVGRNFGLNGRREGKPEIVTMFERTRGGEDIRRSGVRHIDRDDDFDGWVYDLNTEAGTFVGGVGLFVLHNSDMNFPPDSLIRLLKHNKEIVGATYNKRVPPYETLGRLKGAKPTDAELIAGGLREAEQLPGGCMLVRADVYKRLRWPWYWECYQWPGENGVEAIKNFFRDNYSTYADENALAALDSCEPLCAWLNATHKLESVNKWSYYSEDLSFCRKCIKEGISLWCDLDLTFAITHLGVHEVSCKPPNTSVIVPAVM